MNSNPESASRRRSIADVEGRESENLRNPDDVIQVLIFPSAGICRPVRRSWAVVDGRNAEMRQNASIRVDRPVHGPWFFTVDLTMSGMYGLHELMIRLDLRTRLRQVELNIEIEFGIFSLQIVLQSIQELNNVALELRGRLLGSDIEIKTADP